MVPLPHFVYFAVVLVKWMTRKENEVNCNFQEVKMIPYSDETTVQCPSGFLIASRAMLSHSELFHENKESSV